MPGGDVETPVLHDQVLEEVVLGRVVDLGQVEAAGFAPLEEGIHDKDT